MEDRSHVTRDFQVRFWRNIPILSAVFSSRYIVIIRQQFTVWGRHRSKTHNVQEVCVPIYMFFENATLFATWWHGWHKPRGVLALNVIPFWDNASCHLALPVHVFKRFATQWISPFAESRLVAVLVIPTPELIMHQWGWKRANYADGVHTMPHRMRIPTSK